MAHVMHIKEAWAVILVNPPTMGATLTSCQAIVEHFKCTPRIINHIFDH